MNEENMNEEEQALEKYNRDLQYLHMDGDIMRIKIGLVPNMKVEGALYIGNVFNTQLLNEIKHFHKSKNTSYLPAIYQIGNAAALPGIVGLSMGMPDTHCGYGFAIGHVAAFDMDDPEAIVSPGGVGFDINCGVRMLRSNLVIEDLLPVQEQLCDEIFNKVPVGVGGRNEELEVKYRGKTKEIRDLVERGMAWAVENGFAWPEDEEHCEERGCVPFVKSGGKVYNQRAEARGIPQLGTLGSGNHYIEVQKVTDIYNEQAATAMGITKIGQICIMIHCGSRGMGHQYANDAIKEMSKVTCKEQIKINDPMLACARINSPEGQLYLAQMAAASNFAYVNRSIIAQQVREAFSKVFEKSARDLDMHLVYDVAHNIAKAEEHIVNGQVKRLLVHRKGATRAFPPKHPELPAIYQDIGQPVLVGGSMGTCSYVLTGTEEGMSKTFGSTCHGAGRVHGRHEMKRLLKPEEVLLDLKSKGISIRIGSIENIAEEAPSSYKDVTEVVGVRGMELAKDVLDWNQFVLSKARQSSNQVIA